MSLKISIVMPCWNTVEFIERSIRSVVEQNYTDIELIIQDGGSTDGSVEIIKSYSKKYPKIIKWVSQKDKGQADAINQGMKKATGEIMTYLNADDVYKPGALKKVAEYFEKHPKKMWVYGKCDIIDGHDQEIRGWVTAYKNFWLSNYSYATLLILNYISQMGCFWRKEAAEEIGEFDVNQYLVLDYDYWLRLGKKYPAGVIQSYLASFRITDNNKTSLGFIKTFKDEFEVSKRFTNNPIILFLHYLHFNLIIGIYSILKLL